MTHPFVHGFMGSRCSGCPDCEANDRAVSHSFVKYGDWQEYQQRLPGTMNGCETERGYPANLWHWKGIMRQMMYVWWYRN